MPSKIGAYLVIFASPTSFRITAYKKLHYGQKHLNLGSLNRTQRSFEPIG